MEILHEFGVNLVLLIAQAVNFLILLFILRKFLYGPITKVLEERKKRIAQGLSQAEKAEKVLADTQETRIKELRKTKQEAEVILNEASKTAQEIAEDTRKKLEKELEQQRKEFTKELEQKKQQMRDELKKEVITLTIFSLEKIIGKTLTPADQKRITKESFKELNEQKIN